MGVAVGVGAGVAVAVGAGVGVLVGTVAGVGVPIGLGVGVPIGLGVGVPIGLSAGVAVGTVAGVAVAVGTIAKPGAVPSASAQEKASARIRQAAAAIWGRVTAGYSGAPGRSRSAAKWQREKRPGAISVSGGSDVRQTSSAIGQRGWK